MMKNILCYGDSNTFGTNPHGGRWERSERWPGILQHLLGEDYYVIEEGCGGRTTVFEDAIELNKNGRAYLPVALQSHRPLDLVIIMLGTNDMKQRFSLMPEEIAYGASELGRLVDHYDFGVFRRPAVLLVSPIELAEGIENSPFIGFPASAVEVSRSLSTHYRKHAEANGWLFFDAASVAEPSESDKLHMEKESHLALAQALERVIRSYFEEDKPSL